MESNFEQAQREAERILKSSRRRRNPGYVKIDPPKDPVAQPIRHNPPPVLAQPTIPQRPLPPIAIGTDTVKQFEQGQANLPKRRNFSPAPL